MAAGSNWKRPWEEDTDASSAFSAPASLHPRRSSATLPQHTVSELQHEATAGGQAIPPPSVKGGGLSSLWNLTRRSTSLSRGHEQPEHQPGYHALSPGLYKRQRIGDDGVYSMDRIGASASSVLSAKFEGSQDAHDDMRHRAGMASTYDRATAGVNRSEVNARAVDEATSIPQTRDSKSCKTCLDLKGLLYQAISAVDGLYEDMSITLRNSLPQLRENIETLRICRPVPQNDLYESWVWVLDRLSTFRHGVLRGNSPAATSNPKAYSQAVSHASNTKWERDGRPDSQHSKCSPQHDSDAARRSDTYHLASLLASERRNSITGESAQQYMSSSPIGAGFPTSSRPVQPESPVQLAPSARQLPSPSSLNFASSSQFLPPLSPSYPESRSPVTAHLQELQHQLSTKSLAHQILQGEHEKLLAAYSRSQMRCAALDKKSQVSDNEINNLAEDRIVLKGRVELLELQAEELQRGKDEAQKESVVSSAQYRQIMAMAQTQCAADQKKWKADREAWQEEKEMLLLRITAGNTAGESLLKNVGPAACLKSAVKEGKVGSDLEDMLAATPAEALREEVVRLQRSYHDARMTLDALRVDGVELKEVMGKLAAVSNRMSKRSIDMGTR